MPPHWSLSVRVDLFLYGAIDFGEWAKFILDDFESINYTKTNYEGDPICGDGYSVKDSYLSGFKWVWAYYNDKPIPKPVYEYEGKFDRIFYWNHKIYPALKRILELIYPKFNWGYYDIRKSGKKPVFLTRRMEEWN